MVLHYDVVQKAAVGTTAETEENVGTITLNKNAKRVVAFIAASVLAGTVTAAEANLGTFRIESSDLGISEFEVSSPLSMGGSPASQIQAHQVKYKVIPVLFTGDFGNARIKVDYAAETPEPTSDQDAQFFVVYDDGSTPMEIIESLWRGHLPYCHDSKVANEAAGGSTASLALDESPLTIPSRFSKVVGYTVEISLDAAPTTAEEYLAYLSITSSVPGIEPMNVPLCALSAALLGTLNSAPLVIETVGFPLWIDKGDVNETFTLKQEALGATSGAIAYNVSLLSRK